MEKSQKSPTEIRSLIITAVISFALGGAFCGWMANDNNLLQGTTDQQEIAKRLAERQVDILKAVLVGGFLSGLGATGTLLVVRKLTSQRDSA